MQEDFSINTTLRRRVLSKDIARRLYNVKKEILGSSYQLSFVLVGEKKSRTLNRLYRNKNKVSNVLAFPLDENDGEIFITVPRAAREARAKDMSLEEHLGYLFIHGCLHLKGMQHGDTMDVEEQRLFAKFTS